MKIISWNVNSVRARKDQVLQILKEEDPDILCLQETKVVDDHFPFDDFKKLNFFSYFKGISAYNGVAILSKEKAEETSNFDFCNKKDARHLEIKVRDIYISSIYIPAGGDEPEPKTNPKFKHKLSFLKELHFFLKKKQKDKVIMCGDFNIAPYEDDVWSHKNLINVVSHTKIERDELKKIANDCGFIDTTRKFINPPSNVFTWWSYRSPNFEINNRGRRLDHIWASQPLSKNLKGAEILRYFRKNKRPSDHVPVSLEIE
jgi:exodeoxyribonuclease-3